MSEIKLYSARACPYAHRSRLVLGETWVSHYGKNLVESTRCDAAPAQAAHPILHGVSKSFWIPDDVYGISSLSGDCQPLLLGQPLVGWSPEDRPHPDKPAIPIAWTKTHTGSAGKTARVFTTTMGHGDAFKVEDFRRLLADAIDRPARFQRELEGEDPCDIVQDNTRTS